MKKEKPDCYKCKHRGTLQDDCHSMCNHPLTKVDDGEIMALLSMLGAGFAPVSGLEKRLNITGNPHGKRNGWFAWPFNFDPIWLETCEGFEPKEPKTNEMKNTTTQVEVLLNGQSLAEQSA